LVPPTCKHLTDILTEMARALGVDPYKGPVSIAKTRIVEEITIPLREALEDTMKRAMDAEGRV